MYETFRGERIEGLCTLTDHYAPPLPDHRKARAVFETRSCSSSGAAGNCSRTWRPATLPRPFFAILDRPARLARQLEGCKNDPYPRGLLAVQPGINV